MEKGMYDRITSPKSRSFFMTTFSASLTKLTSLLPHSHDCSYWKSKKFRHLHRSHNRNTLVCAYTTSPSLPTFEISIGLLTLPAPGPRDFVKFILLFRRPSYGQKIQPSSSFFILNFINRRKHIVSRPRRFASSEIAASTHCIFIFVDSGQKHLFTYQQYSPDH